MGDERWYTVEEIVDTLKVHEQTVRRWLREGTLRGVLLGRKAGYRVRAGDLEAFLAARDARGIEVEEEGKAPAAAA
ncbi:MAG: helix-turn-helix domain-containing protein [Chloroflexota bacterium]|nr:helix-turn-helix domain-containing protein [Chloroflexota bacterium]